MKTTISVPDPVFEAAEDLTKRLSISRSQLYTTAITRFLESFRQEAITETLNEIYAEEPAAINPALWQMQLHVVNRKSSIVNLK